MSSSFSRVYCLRTDRLTRRYGPATERLPSAADARLPHPRPARGRCRGRSCSTGRPKQRATLAILLLNANRVVSVDRLADDLYAGAAPVTAVTQVQRQISDLRKLLGTAQTVETRAPGYLLRLTSEQLDLQRFERLTAEATRSLDARRAAASGRPPARGARALAWARACRPRLRVVCAARDRATRGDPSRCARAANRRRPRARAARRARRGARAARGRAPAAGAALRAADAGALPRRPAGGGARRLPRHARSSSSSSSAWSRRPRCSSSSRRSSTHDASLAGRPSARRTSEAARSEEPSSSSRRLRTGSTRFFRWPSRLRFPLGGNSLSRACSRTSATSSRRRRLRMRVVRRFAPRRVPQSSRRSIQPVTSFVSRALMTQVWYSWTVRLGLDADRVPDALRALFERSPADVGVLSARGGTKESRRGSIRSVRRRGARLGSARAWRMARICERNARCDSLGTKADAQRGRRDASRLLADASLAAQRVVGVDTRPVLAEPTEEASSLRSRTRHSLLLESRRAGAARASARPAGRSYARPTRRCCSSTAGPGRAASRRARAAHASPGRSRASAAYRARRDRESRTQPG